MVKYIALLLVFLSGSFLLFAQETNTPVPLPPGIIINHMPAPSKLYIGSPALAVLTNGDYVASHDLFGPKSREYQKAKTLVFRSSDKGNSWKNISEVDGAFWASLFVHHGALYLIGADFHHGNIVIRRSEDGGQTWTEPVDGGTGLLTTNEQYHCAPMQVIEWRGRLWRTFERRDPPLGWGTNYCAGMISIDGNADLLNATNWVVSRFLPSDRSWNGGDMWGWLEGNAVVTPDGRMVDVLRVDVRKNPEKAAIVDVSDDGRTLSFNASHGLVTFPGGSKKFLIRYDPVSEAYWALANPVLPEYENIVPPHVRNTLALLRSKDLIHWTVRATLLSHPEVKKHGFQYPDWLFDGNDIIAVVRTGFDDMTGGAHSAHDANFLTFHRFKNFREITTLQMPVGK